MPHGEHMTTFENKTTINASPETVWKTLADVEGISNWAALITSSPVQGAPGLGAIRNCTLADGMEIKETFDTWEDQKAIGYNVAGLPVPLKSTWRIAAVDGGTEVSYHGALDSTDTDMGNAMRDKLSPMSQFLLAALKHNVETGDVLAPPS